MRTFALAAALLGLTPAAAPDGATIVTAGNSSINAREVTLAAEGKNLVVKYVDLGGQPGTVEAADVVEIAFNGGRAASTGRPDREDIEINLTTGDVIVGKVGPK